MPNCNAQNPPDAIYPGDVVYPVNNETFEPPQAAQQNAAADRRRRSHPGHCLMNRLLWVLALALLAATAAAGQGVRYDNFVLGPRGLPSGSAGVAVYPTTGPNVFTITAISESGQVVMATTSTAHGFTAGQQVSIADVKEADYDGLYTIVSVPSPTTFTYQERSTGLASSSGGMATVRPATIYSDEALQTPIANPFQSDSLGNYGFWALPGHYVIQIFGGPYITRSFDVFLSCDPNSTVGCGGVGSATDAVLFVSASGSDSNSGRSRGDAKATIQAALDALPNGSGTVRIGSGQFDVASTIAVPKRATLEGNGKDKTILYWTGAANGTVILASDWSYSHMGGFKVDGAGKAGIGISVTSDGAGPSIEDVVHNVWLVNMNGTPGDDLYVGSTTAQNYEIAQDVFRGILLGSAVNGIYQDGTQTVDNTYERIDQDTGTTNMVNLRNGSASIIGLEGGNATTTIRVSPSFSWLYAYDVEIETPNPSPILLEPDTAIHLMPRNFTDLRILWSGTSGHVFEDDQAGPLTLSNVIISTFQAGDNGDVYINPATGPSGGRVFLTEKNVQLASNPATISRNYSSVQLASLNSGSVLNSQVAFAASNSLIDPPTPAFTLDRDAAGHSSILGFTLAGTTSEGGIGGTPGVSGEVSLFGLKTNGNVLTEVARLGADYSTPKFTLMAPLDANNYALDSVSTANIATLNVSGGGSLAGTFSGAPIFSGAVTFSDGIITSRLYLEGTQNAHMVTDATTDRAWTFPNADGVVTLNVTSGECSTGSTGTATCTFPTAYSATPTCVGTDTTAAAAVRVTDTASAITVTGTVDRTIDWICAPPGAVAGYTP